jgi:hypothetical protein
MQRFFYEKACFINEQALATIVSRTRAWVQPTF